MGSRISHAASARTAGIAIVLLGVPHLAIAQWMAAAYGGAVHTAPADIHIRLPEGGTDIRFPDVDFESRSFESPIYYGYRLSRAVPGVTWLSLEAELIHAKAYATGNPASAAGGTVRGVPRDDVRFRELVEELALSHGHNFILLNAVVRHRLPVARATLALRAGMGPMLPHREVEFEGRREEGYELAGLGMHVSGGAELRLWRGVGVLSEYKWTFAATSVSVGSGSASLNTRSHHLAAGTFVAF